MKSIKLTYLLVCALAMTLAATGCKKKPTNVTRLPDYAQTGPKEDGPTQLPPTNPVNPNENPFGNPLPALDPDSPNWTKDRATLAVNTVHFDYDSATVKASEKANVEAVATYMKSTANVALLIEGHCDERGTEEYNRSLGERRALALREALISSGADASRITTRSFGEDKPAAVGHDESAWRQNRRGEFVVLHPK